MVTDAGVLAPLPLRNRIIKSATFEGATPRGEVTDRLVEFHRQVAAGGVAMSTVAYCAVAPGGRGDPHCLGLGDDTPPALRRVTDAVHAQGAPARAQVGPAGVGAGAPPPRGVGPRPRRVPGGGPPPRREDRPCGSGPRPRAHRPPPAPPPPPVQPAGEGLRARRVGRRPRAHPR